MDAKDSSSETTTLPNFIYVSELLRTWETAVLLFLSLLNTNLTLYISPFLREKGLIPFPSDIPGELKEQVKEFIRFIAFLKELKKLNIDDISELIPESFTIILKHFGGNFDTTFTKDIEKPEGVELSIEGGGGIQISCRFSDGPGSKPDDTSASVALTIKLISDKISVDNSPNSSYVPYDVNSELKFPNASSEKTDGDMNTPSEPAGSLADFVDWYNKLQIKPHGIGVVYFVSHSGTMNRFVAKVKKLNPEDSSFSAAYKRAVKTNTCSLLFKENSTDIFQGFRHAYSCDNRYMDKGFNLLNFNANFVDQRWKGGYYTNLGLWGILSTLKFSEKKLPLLIQAGKEKVISPTSFLEVCKGMDKEPPDYHQSSFDNVNKLCGKQRDRVATNTFTIVSGHCGTSSTFKITINNDCIRITTHPKGRKVVLYLDKEKNTIEARFFISVNDRVYTTPDILENKEINNQLKYIVCYLLQCSTDDETIVKKYVDELKRSMRIFINSNPSYSSWGNALTNLFPEESQEELDSLQTKLQPPEHPRSVLVTAGGTNKRTRRHRRRHGNYKVMKKYTRKNKKYNPRRKSRRIQKRKQTHKRKSCKSRKSRKSRK